MEINVTKLVVGDGYDCEDFANSIARSGREDIGKVTWRNACVEASKNPLVGPESQDTLRAWLREFGAWSAEEIEAMSDVETNALLLQFVAGDVQEIDMFETYKEYRAAQERGEVSGYLYQGDDGEWYFRID